MGVIFPSKSQVHPPFNLAKPSRRSSKRPVFCSPCCYKHKVLSYFLINFINIFFLKKKPQKTHKSSCETPEKPEKAEQHVINLKEILHLRPPMKLSPIIPLNSTINPLENLEEKTAIIYHHSQRPSQDTKYPSLDKKSLNIDQNSNLSDVKTLLLQENLKNEVQKIDDSIQMCTLPVFEINNICDIYPVNFDTVTMEENQEKSQNSDEIAVKQEFSQEKAFMNFREIEINFQKGNKIGMGPHGKVYESLNLNSGEILAVKTINPEEIEEENAVFFQKNLLEIKHENVLFYRDFGYSDKKRSFLIWFFNSFFILLGIELVSEYIAGGSLKNLLEKFGKFEEVVASLFAKQIMNGLQFLHSKSIFHKFLMNFILNYFILNFILIFTLNFTMNFMLNYFPLNFTWVILH